MLGAIRGTGLDPLPTNDEAPEAFPANDPSAAELRRFPEQRLCFVRCIADILWHTFLPLVPPIDRSPP
jgi:hypothetical protein